MRRDELMVDAVLAASINNKIGEFKMLDISNFADTIDRMQVVFKIAERCNINCTYCYYFNMGEETPMERPALIDLNQVADVAEALRETAIKLSLKSLHISFHGGEPMMIGVKRFDELCRALVSRLADITDLSFSIQTNGTINVTKWMPLFETYKVGLSFSIDGNKAAHDRYRLSKNGKSTFMPTERNYKRALDYCREHNIPAPSVIAVMDAKNDYREIYRYFRELGVEQMTFLLPDTSHDDQVVKSEEFDALGKALFDIFDAWLKEDNPRIRIRHVDRYLEYIGPAQTQPQPQAKEPNMGRKQILLARSDGSFAVDDSYTPALEWYQTTPVAHPGETSLYDYLNDPIFLAIERFHKDLSPSCMSCKWLNLCRGGDLENRYSRDTGFKNPSVYCDSYKAFFERFSHSLISAGLPKDCLPLQT